MLDVLARLDATVGDRLEAAVRLRHRRRLDRAGWAHALTGSGSGWATGGPPPRRGNAVEVIVDGAAAMPRIAADIASARSHVHVAGWFISPDFAMVRSPAAPVLVRDLLADTATRADVRVLMWSGPPVPMFHPWRSEVRRARDALVSGTRVRCELDAHNRPMHCHHEKVVVVDDEIAYVGGIDLTSLAGDRFDRAPHPAFAAHGWHDVAVRITGPAVADVAAHLLMRWRAVTGERLEAPVTAAATGDREVQVVRTVPGRIYPDLLPAGDYSILDAYLGALSSARGVVYLENQFLWSTEVVAVLAGLLRTPPSDRLRVVILLPARPNNGRDTTRGQLAVLRSADADDRLVAATLGPAPGGSDVYVHAKVGIVDDRWLTVGSANLNEHSLFNDTEMNVVLRDEEVARSTRERLWTEHLGTDVTGRDPVEVVDTLWRNAATPGSASPGAAVRPLPATSHRSARLLGPLTGVLVDG